MGRGRSSFALIVVHITVGGEDLVDSHAPDADLIGIGIDSDVHLMDHVEVDVDEHLGIGCVGELVRAFRTGGKKQQLSRSDLPLSCGRSERTFAAEDIEGLFVIVMEVKINKK